MLARMPPPPRRQASSEAIRKPVPQSPQRLPSEILDRIPPSNIEAEKAVIGSILLAPKAMDEVGNFLDAGDFYAVAHQTIYACLLSMSAVGERIDAALLVDRLRRNGELEACGGMGYLVEIAQAVPVSAHAVYYAKIVLRESRRRQVVSAATEVLRSAWDSQLSPDDLLSFAEGAFGAIRSGLYDRDPVSLEAATIDAMGQIEEIVGGKRTAGVHIGLPAFDEEVGGVFCEELTILGARPSQGKSSLALQAACYCASQGLSTYFATLEMSRIEIATKGLCSRAGVSHHWVRTGRLGPSEYQALATAGNFQGNGKLFLHDWPEIRVWDIERSARRLGVQIVFVDYLQIVTPPDAKKKRYEQVGEVAKALKLMARRLRVPVVACAQIGRQAEGVKDSGPPALHHLRESGDIENHCDMALLLWRPEAVDKDGGYLGVPPAHRGRFQNDVWDANLCVAKNRLGATPTIRLDWDRERTVFRCHKEQEVF